MEIGSFIELQFPSGKEWHTEGKYPNMQIARLNSGRCAIYHAVKRLGCDKVYLPYYQCDTVREFLRKKGIKVEYYFIDEKFEPLLVQTDKTAAVVIVNYYGIMSNARMKRLADKYQNVVLDNAQAFFAEPIEGCMNVYSARKFVGVPDGAYVIGKNALDGYEAYEQGYSSDTASFLLERHEYDCEGRTYQSRAKNEERIDSEDVKKMSALTRKILDGTDYSIIRQKRKENFFYACELFETDNLIKPKSYYEEDVIPMVYPLVIEDKGLLPTLLNAKHFQGHWWSYLLQETPVNSFENWLSRYVIPITIDQRYGKEELEYIKGIVSGK